MRAVVRFPPRCAFDGAAFLPIRWAVLPPLPLGGAAFKIKEHERKNEVKFTSVNCLQLSSVQMMWWSFLHLLGVAAFRPSSPFG